MEGSCAQVMVMVMVVMLVMVMVMVMVISDGGYVGDGDDEE